MEDNPFLKLVNRIKNENESNYPTTHRFGTVNSSNPLKIEIEGLTFESEELLKSSHLISFKIGEELLLIPIENGQRYVIIAKVVDV